MADPRVPPQAPEAEQSTLGSMMLSAEAIEEAARLLQPADFYTDQHRAVFETIVSMFCRSQPVDFVTLQSELTAAKKFEVAGGLPYLASLLHTVPTPANVRHYAEIVAEKAMLRRLADVGSKLYNRAFSPDAEAKVLLEWGEKNLSELHGEKRPGEGFESLETGLPNEIAAINAAYARGEDLIGVRSGYGEIDVMTGGWQKGDLIVLGARPSMGKSTCAIDLVMTAAEFQTGAVAMFSLEMSRSQIYRRLLSSGRGSFGQEVDGHRIRTPSLLTDEDWAKLAGTVDRLYRMPVWLDDSPSMTVAEMRSACRRLKANHGLSFVAVD
jgi:replicative DNA helicase